MSFGIFLAVLFAAFLHAFWNALVKTGASKQTSMLVLSLGHGAIGLLVVGFRPFPGPEVWPWLLGSGLIHMAYQLFLAYAYEQGDLSRVYPIARGAAPMMVLLFSILFLGDAIAAAEYSGIIVLGCGIALMARGVFSNGESRRGEGGVAQGEGQSVTTFAARSRVWRISSIDPTEPTAGSMP